MGNTHRWSHSIHLALRAVKALPWMAALAIAAPSHAGPPNASNGTTLAAYKTIDICMVNEALWRYSGVITVWNEGAVDTTGFKITDLVENKPGNKWLFAFSVPVSYSGEIPAGTTQTTALAFPYSVDFAPLSGTIRNTANLTITNHSGNLGKDFGPSPKATYTGSVPPRSCDEASGGCVRSQGYWGNKPDVIWPAPYDRNALFYLSGQTWQGVMDTPVNVSQGYYQLAQQYIAALLNAASNAAVPQGVQDTLALAHAWLSANTPAACTAPGSCGMQKDWAKVLESYDTGEYPGGPAHCVEE
jgi:hypothetical protein